MGKYLNIFIKTGIMLTIIPFIVIVYNALMNTDTGFFLNNITTHPEYIFWFVTILIFLLVVVIFKFINKWNNKKKRILKYALIGTLLLIQTILILDIHPIFVTDSYRVIDQGMAIADGLDKIVDYNSTFYFQIYSNNNLFLLIVIMLSKIFNFSNYLVLFNTIFIDLAVFLTYKVAQKLKDDNFALKVLVLSVINPLNYFFIFWPYTNTFSWPFIIGIIYLALLIKDLRKIDLKFIIYSVLFGLTALIGYMLRPIMIIPLTAIFITFILYLIVHKKKIKNYFSLNWKKLTAVVLLVFVIVGFSYKGITHTIKEFYPDDSKNFPIVHWLMVGMSENGTIDESYNDYTSSFDTKEEKVKGNIKKINELIEGYGPEGLIHHFISKLPVNYSGYYYYQINKIERPSKFFQYLYGEKSDFINIYSNAFRNFLFILVLMSLFSQLKIRKLDYRILFTITLFGMILFYLLWEVKNTYHLPFISIMIILAAFALDPLSQKISNLNNKQKKKCYHVGLLCILFTIMSFVSLYQGFTRPSQMFNDYQLKFDYDQYIIYKQNVASNNDILKQEFYAYGKFNSVSLMAYKIKDNDTIYDIKIYDGKNVIASKELTAKDISNDRLKISFDLQNPNGKHKYLITISSKDKEDSISFGYAFTRSGNIYPGNLYINNKKLNSDLAIIVSQEYYGAFISKTLYILLMIFVLLIEIAIIKNLFYKKKVE